MSLDIKLNKLFTARAVLLEYLHLQVPSGVIHTVMGSSGSGKSSLLAALCGTLPEGVQFDGEVSLDGKRVDQLPTEKRQIGILVQEDLLFAHMTVAENLMFAVPAGPREERLAQVRQGLDDLEMSGYGQANPATLSGGQRARVALMRDFVFELVRKRGIPVLMVTHDLSDVADRTHLTTL
jgi:putative thiamine transport system ATP-binding protein